LEHKLVCADCGKQHKEQELKQKPLRCIACGGVLDVVYADGTTPDKRAVRMNSGNKGIWRFADFLPDCGMKLTMGEGDTALVRARNLGKKLGLDALYIKNEGQNPSGTYKDRGMAVAMSKARDMGYERVTLGSAGNAGAAAAAYAAYAGLRCELLLPTGAVRERIRLAQLYGAHVTLIDGSIDDCINFSLDLQKKFGWGCVSTARPYSPYCVEGYKTLGYELAEQFRFELPDWLVVPIGGGSLISKIWQGLNDFKNLGLLKKLPRLLGVQAEGCSPYIQHFKSGAPVEKWNNPDTIAFAIADVWPFDAELVDKALKESGGTADAVTDAEILAAMQLLAGEEGLLAEPASATVIAVLQNKVKEGLIKNHESVACVVSGNGIKDLALSTKDIPEPQVIKPSWDEVCRAVNA